MDLVFFGIQGSGKGTQAKLLAADFGYDIFEAGGELRKIAASGSALGQTVKSSIDAGNLVPHEIIIAVVKEAILARPKDMKLIFDGIPRDFAQQRDFDMIMKNVGREFRCIHFVLDPEKAVERILARATAQGRVDDRNEEIIRKRMKTFQEKTVPVIETYRSQGKMNDIDADRSREEIYGALKRELTRLRPSGFAGQAMES